MSTSESLPVQSQQSLQKHGFWRAPIRFLFGYDVFISYGRNDADAYANALETKLEALGFATFRDKREINTGDELDSALKTAIRRSRQFVLLDTPGARRSPWVTTEVKTYLQSKGHRLARIVREGKGNPPNAWRDEELAARLESFVWAADTPEAFAIGRPSDEVVEQISRNFRTIRLRHLMRLSVAAVIAGLSGLLIWSVRQTSLARRQARIATARELVSASIIKQDADPELSMVLAMYAVAATLGPDHAVLPEAEQRLHVSLLKSRERLALEHGESVNAITWSPDGKLLATASGDNTAKVWEVESGRELLTLRGHTEGVNGIAWSADGRRLATSSFDNTAKVWAADSGHELLTIRGHHANVRSVDWSPDNIRLATGSEDHTASVWNALSGEGLLTLHGQGDSFTAAVWSPDGQRLATASHENAAKVWNARTAKELLTLRGHTGTVMALAWSPDSKKLATAALDGFTKVWDALTGSQLLAVANEGRSVGGVSWSQNGTRLATGYSDGTAKVWDVKDIQADGEVRDGLDVHNGVAPGTRQSPPSEGFTQIVPVESTLGKELLVLVGHTGSVDSIAWSRDGQRLATGSQDGTARVWDTGDTRELLTLSGLGSVSAVAVSPDGKRFATGSYRYDSATEVWNSVDGTSILILRGHTGQVKSIAWSPDGLRLATGSQDNTAKIWDALTGKEQLTLLGHVHSIENVAWSPDGKRLVTASVDETARLWDSWTGKELHILRGHRYSVDGVAWSPDGKELASGGDDTAKVWDAESGKEIMSLTGGNGSPCSVAWSPDGTQLALGSGDVLKVWSMPAGKERLTLKGDGNVTGVLWSRDGKRLAAGVGMLLKVWDARNGKELLALPNGSDILSIDWTPDDRHLVAGSLDGTVHVYTIDIHELMMLAGRRITRKLTSDECRIYLHLAKCSEPEASPNELSD